MQTFVPKRDVSVQCSLLPAPPLSYQRTGPVSSMSEVNSLTDLDTEDEVLTEVEDSDTDYNTDVADNVEGYVARLYYSF